METAITAIQTVFLGICQRKDFENGLLFAEVMTKKQIGCFFWKTVYIAIEMSRSSSENSTNKSQPSLRQNHQPQRHK